VCVCACVRARARGRLLITLVHRSALGRVRTDAIVPRARGGSRNLAERDRRNRASRTIPSVLLAIVVQRAAIYSLFPPHFPAECPASSGSTLSRVADSALSGITRCCPVTLRLFRRFISRVFSHESLSEDAVGDSASR